MAEAVQTVASPVREVARAARIRRALWLAIGLNALVAAAKIIYGTAAHCLAIEADGYHSLSDGFSSLVALVGLGLSLRPADDRHPYGHRKFEVLAASAMGISLLFLAARIGSDVMSHVRSNDHHAPVLGWPAFVVLLGTLAVNLGVSIYQTRLGRALGSSLLESDGKHTRADCYVTAGVLVATTLSWAGFPAFDLPAAAIVVVLIAMAGFDILATNAPYLTDAALVAPERIRRAVGRVVAAESVHAIRTRGTPDAVFVDLRVRLRATLSVREADAIVGDLVAAIRGEIEAVADVVVQVECDRGG